VTEPRTAAAGRPPLRPWLFLALLLGFVLLGSWSHPLPDGWLFGPSAWADDDGDDGGDDDNDDGGEDGEDDSGSDDGGKGSGSGSGDSGGEDGGDSSGDGNGSDDSGQGDDGSEDPGAEGEHEGSGKEKTKKRSGRAQYLLPRLFGRESGDPEHERDTILAVDLSPAELAAVEARGFRVRDAQRLLGLDLGVTRLRPPPGMSVQEASAELRRLVPRRAVDLDQVYRLQEGTCEGPQCWPLRLVDWAGRIAACAPLRPIGVIDTGVDRSRPALRDAAIEVRHLVEGRRADPDHGTAIAALLVGGRGTALLPGTRLLIADVFRRDAEGALAGPLEIARGLDWLVRRGASPINLSLAGPDNAVLRLAVERVLARGFVLVAAAGNGGPWAEPAYPAAYPGVIAVTAVDRELQPYPRANRGPYIAFAAPGVGLVTGEGTPALSGTSYATPFVTAAAALLLADGRPRSPAGLETELALRARDLGPPGRDPVFGWGLVRRPRACAS